MIKQDLNAFKNLFSGYTELRLQENRELLLTFVNGNNVLNKKSVTAGVSSRVYKNGSWGFSSNPVISKASIKDVIKDANDNACFLDSKINKNKKPFNNKIIVCNNDFSAKPNRVSQNEINEYIKEIDNYVAKKYPSLVKRSITLSCSDIEKNLITSAGSICYSMTPNTLLVIHLTTIKDGKPVELFEYWGGLGQFEDVLHNPEQHYSDIDNIYNELMQKAEGEYAEAGLNTCILDSRLAGVLAHEAVGHTTEADFVMSGSVAGQMMSKQAASPLITLVDFANTAFGETCTVPIYADDEGTPAEDVVIIENGILKNYMHNKESAQYFDVHPKGNARASQFSDEPLIRMRNTAILPGKSKLEDMIESVEDGYYLTRRVNGQADSTGEFMFGVNMGYHIKNGKIGKAIKDLTISGMAFELLKTVDMVSDELTWNSTPCGKKQMISVSMGGPAIRCKVNLGGR